MGPHQELNCRWVSETPQSRESIARKTVMPRVSDRRYCKKIYSERDNAKLCMLTHEVWSEVLYNVLALSKSLLASGASR